MAAPNMSIGPSPPTSPVAGDLWYNDVSGLLFIWYVDATSAQWVVANPGIGAQGTPGSRGPAGPPGPPYAAPKRVGTLYQAQPFDSLVIDTTVEAIRIMMPPAPSDLDSILFSPANDMWGNPNLLIVDFQGQLINTHADILAGDVPTQFELVFYAGYGWRLHSQHGGPGPQGSSGAKGESMLSPTYSPVFTAGVYNMTADDLGKTFEVTTGSSGDLVINLLDPTTVAADGHMVAFYKLDTGTSVLILRNADGSDNTHLQLANDFIRLRVGVDTWHANDTRLNDVMRIYSANDTWLKRPRLTRLRLFGVGGGGGGGSGRRGAAGTARSGGAGGGVGQITDRTYLAQSLTFTSIAITVGADAPGGPAVTADDTSGNNGTTGNDAFIVNYFRARGGAAGIGGGTTAAAGALSQLATDRYPVINGGSSSITANPTATGSAGGAGSGAGGGGISTGNVPFNGGNGGVANTGAYNGAGGGVGGIAPGGVGLDGVTVTFPASRPDSEAGSGGGGGAASITGPGGSGGNGGAPGGAGAGGGASLNGSNSGAGGIGRGARLILFEQYAR